MKLIIEIDENNYNWYKDYPEVYTDKLESIIANGIPYEPKGDLISREALRKNMEFICMGIMAGTELYNAPLTEIDNAPTVCGNNPKWCESCVSKGKCASTRPQGDLISREALKDDFECVGFNDYDDFNRALRIIDNAPTVEYTFDEAFQKTICEQKLYCPARPKGEWRDNLIEVFRQSAEVGGDMFHLSEIERIINGEPI